MVYSYFFLVCALGSSGTKTKAVMGKNLALNHHFHIPHIFSFAWHLVNSSIRQPLICWSHVYLVFWFFQNYYQNYICVKSRLADGNVFFWGAELKLICFFFSYCFWKCKNNGKNGLFFPSMKITKEIIKDSTCDSSGQLLLFSFIFAYRMHILCMNWHHIICFQDPWAVQV